MRILAIISAIALLPLFSHAQDAGTVVTNKKIKVIFQLTSSDTLVQKSLTKQLFNFLAAAPKAKLEVVCHNAGISYLQTASTKYSSSIRDLTAKGVDFVACENTMRERKIKREELLKECRTVPAGVVEIALKQDMDWVYIRATQ